MKKENEKKEKEKEDSLGISLMNKVSLQTSLERNPTNSSYIFILSVNFENLTVRLYVVIAFLMLTKFQEDQRSIIISSNKC